jgi:geranylgeranyl transferase type-2 subunit alpha
MPVRRSEKAELAYTTKKIEANFSNFSAWHQRTKVLSSLWASGEVDRASSLQKGKDLFDCYRQRQPNYHNQSLSWCRMPCSPCRRTRVRGCIIAGSLVQVGYLFFASSLADLIVVPGEDKGTLEREIEVVQTLLDEQQDSKCECSVKCYPRHLRCYPYLCRVYGVTSHVQAIASEESYAFGITREYRCH